MTSETRVEITFRSGAKVELDLSEFTLKTRDESIGELDYRMEAAYPGQRRVVWLNLGQVDAIVDVIPSDYVPTEDADAEV